MVQQSASDSLELVRTVPHTVSGIIRCKFKIRSMLQSTVQYSTVQCMRVLHYSPVCITPVYGTDLARLAQNDQ